MNQIQVPCFPISERTAWTEIAEDIQACFDQIEAQGASCPPIFLFEPHPEWRLPSEMPTVSEAPEELVVVVFEPSIRTACFQALERVAEREPKFPSLPPKQKSIKVKENTPIKSFFRQMTEMPASVFSITFPDNGPDAISVFFLRTAFTISEFRREVTKPIE